MLCYQVLVSELPVNGICTRSSINYFPSIEPKMGLVELK